LICAIAERFGCLPWEIEVLPVDKVVWLAAYHGWAEKKDADTVQDLINSIVGG